MKRLMIAGFIFLMVLTNLYGMVHFSEEGGKKLDLLRYHNVGNIWLRVSNYGFFGSGKDITPRYPSLEYPGGSGIDYLFRGALWFGAKKIRRDAYGNRYYWLPDAQSASDIVTEFDADYAYYDSLGIELKVVIDTLVTVGYDGDMDVKEMLPAYNPLETSPLGSQYDEYNHVDITATTSIRQQRRGEDDDGDGLIDEDPLGYSFPFRKSSELPSAFNEFGESWLHDLTHSDMGNITDNVEIWFPLGFVNLADQHNTLYNYTQPADDDGDTLYDEDGYPVSEQDFISYYYDYSPFGTLTERDWGSWDSQNEHHPLRIRIRQMSYQWSYEHIKNLVYVEFDVTNMNFTSTFRDTLYDCAMGIYMDSDVGPQAWDEIYADDVSSYVRGPGYEFAYTYDLDGDNGLTRGLVGSRVCTPDPEQLEFACWTWDSGDGPDDSDPLQFNPSTTANEKYWLLTNYRNPNEDKFTSLRDFPNTQLNSGGLDTRYLFGFYGAQEHTGDTDAPGEEGYGVLDYLEQNEEGEYFKRWNLAPEKTMKIVIAVFPGDDLLSLMQTSIHAKDTYGEAQNLITVTEADTFIHYIPPEPPEIPMMYAEISNNGNSIDVYWDNRSQIDNLDTKTVKPQQIGWQETDTLATLDSHLSNWPAIADICPPEFAPYEWDETSGTYNTESPANRNPNAYVNPWTGFRLRHDFQGYSLWGRSGSGSQEHWMLEKKWDKIETAQDEEDYMVNSGTDKYIDFCGETGLERGLANGHTITQYDVGYYHYNEFYELVAYTNEDLAAGITVYGKVLYDKEMTSEIAQELIIEHGIENDEEAEALLFKNPEVDDKVYLELFDDRLIPLANHLGQSSMGDTAKLEKLRKDRLSRRYYQESIYHPPKGIEYYVAVSAWDRGMPSLDIPVLQSARDAEANMKVFFPGSLPAANLNDIYVVPNPYLGHSSFDGKKDNDEKGDKSRRIWFVNLPERCQIKVWTLAGDLVDTIEHDADNNTEEIINISKAAAEAQAAGGIEAWDMLSRFNQIIAPGVYLFSVRDRDSGKNKVGKFVIIK